MIVPACRFQEVLGMSKVGQEVKALVKPNKFTELGD
jgi:hypothetical protein